MQNIKKVKVWRRLAQIKPKNLFAQIILDKILGAKYRNPVKLDSGKQFGMKFSMSFHSYSKTKYHVSFYLWLINFVLKNCNVPKYYDRDCLKVFWLLSTLPVIIWISGRTPIWFKKDSSVKKVPINDHENFLETVFDLKWTWKILLTESHWIWNFKTTDLL